MADKDLAEKYLESFADVFADIYNVLLFQKEILLEEGLEEGPTESIYKVEENNLRNQFRDTVKLYKNGLYKVASFGIENESLIDKNMPIRIMGYDYAVYRAQIDRGEERKYPAITIVLNFSDTEWKSPNALFDILDVAFSTLFTQFRADCLPRSTCASRNISNQSTTRQTCRPSSRLISTSCSTTLAMPASATTW